MVTSAVSTHHPHPSDNNAAVGDVSTCKVIWEYPPRFLPCCSVFFECDFHRDSGCLKDNCSPVGSHIWCFDLCWWHCLGECIEFLRVGTLLVNKQLQQALRCYTLPLLTSCFLSSSWVQIKCAHPASCYCYHAMFFCPFYTLVLSNCKPKRSSLFFKFIRLWYFIIVAEK